MFILCSCGMQIKQAQSTQRGFPFWLPGHRSVYFRSPPLERFSFVPIHSFHPERPRRPRKGPALPTPSTQKHGSASFQTLHPPHHGPEEPPCQMPLRQQQPIIPCVLDQPAARNATYYSTTAQSQLCGAGPLTRSRPPGRPSCGGPGSPPGGGLAVQGDRPTTSKWHWAHQRPVADPLRQHQCSRNRPVPEVSRGICEPGRRVRQVGSQWRHGNLGLDLLNQARVVTIDFQSMTLALEQAIRLAARGSKSR